MNSKFWFLLFIQFSYFIQVESYFGWSFLNAKSEAELVCDGIGAILLALLVFAWKPKQ